MSAHSTRAVSANVVKSRIAELILGEPRPENALRQVKLHRHQVSAVHRLLLALDQFNGALLCDDVGMGKTFVALAIARRFTRCLVVAPAVLISMWRAALDRTGISADLMTFETLSRADQKNRDGTGAGATKAHSFDLVIVDEAHHVRNPRTNRFFVLESLVRGAKVLLLSATPIHNRRQDLAALFSLFLGSRAQSLTSAELALAVVRREHRQIERSVPMPIVNPTVRHEIPDDPVLVAQLLDLPPPVPLRDGGLGGALIGRGLVHLWASSEAALHEALKKRIARAGALCASLEAGTYPTAQDLESWIYSEGTMQLAFAELLSAPVADHAELLQAIRSHLLALQGILARFHSRSSIDEARADAVARIQASNAGSRTVAFAQYAETISMLFRCLVRTQRVAMLTSHGARVAGGSLTRKEAISRFAPLATGSSEPAPAERIELLLTSDLLSEGVNLHDANTVIHLDIPWTAARMEQRVGRVVRLGSPHVEARVHMLVPPKSAQEILRGETIVRRKWQTAKSAIGSSSSNPGWQASSDIGGPGAEAGVESVPSRVERLRAALALWIPEAREDHAGYADGASTFFSAGATHSTVVAAVSSAQSGFIAAVSLSGAPQLLVGRGTRVSTDLDVLVEGCSRADGEETISDAAGTERAVDMIYGWAANERAREAAGLVASTASQR
ncbi:MAG: SNF2-related protein, partial [Gemmatimonadaceae bacterium]